MYGIPLLLLSLCLAAGACASVGVDQEEARSAAFYFGGEFQAGSPPYSGFKRQSFYFTARDGTDIALDLYLPEGLEPGTELPAVITATRYWRRWNLAFPLSRFNRPDLLTRMLVRHGYAVLQVDARGSGASFGSRDHPWTRAEREDYRDLMDWILEREWSNGKIGAAGISYEGTAAEFMGLLGHPACKAVVIRSSLFDVYADIAFPGGVYNEYFVSRWGAFNAALDRGRPPKALPDWLAPLVLGPAPVDGPHGKELLPEALADHATNVDIDAAARQVRFRDETSDLAGASVDEFSPHALYTGKTAPPAVLAFGGWMDGAYADSLLKRFMAHQGPHRAFIGAWNHAGTEDADPYADTGADPEPSEKLRVMEMLRFFDHYLKGLGEKPKREITFQVMGSREWRVVRSWPPPGTTRRLMHLTPGPGLSREVPDSAKVEYAVEYAWGSGENNRWRTQLMRSDVDYPLEEEYWSDLLVFESEPLKAELTLAGSPVLSLRMSSSLPDLALHAYLQSRGPDGRVHTLSEGLFRPLMRRRDPAAPPQAPGAPRHSYRSEDALPVAPGKVMSVEFGLLSTAAAIPAGHRLRLVLAGHDKDQFARYPESGVPMITILTGPADGSGLVLPVLDEDLPGRKDKVLLEMPID
jgi:putative CocE/NonD family hydrolase